MGAIRHTIRFETFEREWVHARPGRGRRAFVSFVNTDKLTFTIRNGIRKTVYNII